MAKGVLTTGQKIQIAVILLGLATSSFLVFSTFKPDVEPAYRAVAPTQRQFPVDTKHPFSPAKNPYDPKKDEVVNTFLSSDGTVTLVEFPNDPSKALSVEFHPDRRGQKRTFQYYVDPVTLADAIKDPFSRAMAYAVYLKVYSTNRRSGTDSVLLALRPPLTEVQRQQEAAARQSADQAIQAIEDRIAAGTFETELLKQLTAALREFQDDKNKGKADQATQDQQAKIWQLAADYKNKQNEAMNAEADKYVLAMKEILAPDQRENLIAEVALRRARATNPAPPVRRPATRAASTARSATRPGTRATHPATSPESTPK